MDLVEPVILLVAQALAVSLGALPVFWLARKHLGFEKAATAFAIAYLAYPATQWNALDPNLGFHPVSLALPLVLYALWWLGERSCLSFVTAVLSPFWTAVPVDRDAIMGSPPVQAERHAVSLIPDGVPVVRPRSVRRWSD